MFVTSPKQHPNTSAQQRHSASHNYDFFQVYCLLFSMMLAPAGCEGRSVQGLARARALPATEEASSRYSLPLVPSEIDLNLGQVAPGSQKSLAFWLTNQSAAPVEVAEITSGCDCLKVELPERCVAPGQRVKGGIELDLRKEPHFTGKLGIEVRGTEKTGQIAFILLVKVVVQNEGG